MVASPVQVGAEGKSRCSEPWGPSPALEALRPPVHTEPALSYTQTAWICIYPGCTRWPLALPRSGGVPAEFVASGLIGRIGRRQ